MAAVIEYQQQLDTAAMSWWEDIDLTEAETSVEEIQQMFMGGRSGHGQPGRGCFAEEDGEP